MRTAQTAKVNFFSDASLPNRNTSESFLVKALVKQTPVQAGAQKHFFFLSSALWFDPLLLWRCHEDIILNSRLSQYIPSWEQLYRLYNTSHSSPVNIEDKKKKKTTASAQGGASVIKWL